MTRNDVLEIAFGIENHFCTRIVLKEVVEDSFSFPGRETSLAVASYWTKALTSCELSRRLRVVPSAQ